jgi:tetratricopeptide (TPR) repeat protein
MEMDASLLIGLERYDEAEDALRASLRRAQAADDRAEVSRALEALGVVATRRGNDDQALDFFRQAVSAGGYPNPVERSELYYELARLTSAAGDPAAAAKLLQGCLERIRRDSPDALDAIARYSYVLSYAYTDAGDYAAAAAVLARVLREGGEEIGLDLRATVFYALGRLHNALGQYQLALQYCRSCLEIRARQGRSYIVGDTHMHVASVLLSLGETEEAAEHLAEARACYGSSLGPIDEGILFVEEARLALLEERAEDGVESARRAVELLASGAAVGELGLANQVLARGYATLGDQQRADAAYSAAIGLLRRQNGWRAELARAYREYAGFLRQCGRNEAALDAYATAADVGEGLPET